MPRVDSLSEDPPDRSDGPAGLVLAGVLSRRDLLRALGAVIASPAAGRAITSAGRLVRSVSGPTGPLSPPGAVLRVGTRLVLVDSDPLTGAAGTLVEAVYDTLTAIAPGSYAVVSRLARSWSRASATSLVLELDPRARFADGSVVTADDVVFSIEAAATGNPALGGVLAPLAALSAQGPTRVRVASVHPDPLLERRLSVPAVVSATAYGSVAPGVAPKLVGSGRYVLAGFRPGESAAFSASTESWLGPPATAHVGIAEAVSSDEIASLLSDGRVDVGQDLAPASLPGLAGRFRLESMPTGVISMLVPRSIDGPFADLRTRQALWSALDVEALVSGPFAGAASPLGGQLALTGMPGRLPLPGPGQPGGRPPDVATARRLLERAGHRSGIDTVLAGLGSQRPLLDALAGQLAAAGIRARVEGLGASAWTAALASGSSWPMLLAEVDLAPLFDPDAAYAALTGRGRPGFRQSVGSRELVALDAAQAGDLDPAQRAATLRAMALLVSSDALVVPLVAREQVLGWRPEVSGVVSLGTELALERLLLRAS